MNHYFSYCIPSEFPHPCTDFRIAMSSQCLFTESYTSVAFHPLLYVNYDHFVIEFVIKHIIYAVQKKVLLWVLGNNLKFNAFLPTAQQQNIGTLCWYTI